MRGTYNWLVMGLKVGLAALLSVFLLVTSAAAAVVASVELMWPESAAVGDLFNASLHITNVSTSPNETENVRLTAVFVTPACADGISPICLAAPVDQRDPGIFKILSAVGDASTPPCAEVDFMIGLPDESTGEVELTPMSIIIMGPSAGIISRTCQVNILLRVFRVPTNPADGPPVTTNPLARVALVGQTSGLAGQGSSATEITIEKGVVGMTSTRLHEDIAAGTQVYDKMTITKAPGAIAPTGLVRFILCQPDQVTAAGCPGGSGTKVGADKLPAFGLAISDPSTDTTTIGTYCWRVRFLGDDNYLPQNHTNATTECFTTH
jgi:hypothetical protein